MLNWAAAERRADEDLFSAVRPLKPRVRPPQAATRGDRRGPVHPARFPLVVMIRHKPILLSDIAVRAINRFSKIREGCL
jgi:hypothetical protein